MSDDFSWQRDPSVIVPEQAAIAVYPNSRGGVTIRQERAWDDQHDTIITIAPTREAMTAVLYALIEATDLPFMITECLPNGYRDVERPPRLTPEDDVDQAEPTDRQQPAPRRRAPIAERRALATAALRTDPRRSNRAIASECGVSDKTVATLRAEIETGAEIRSAETRSPEIRTADAPRQSDAFALVST